MNTGQDAAGVKSRVRGVERQFSGRGSRATRAAVPPPKLERAPRVRFGDLWVDAVTLAQTLAAIEQLVDQGAGGAVFTPNVDHVVIASRRPDFVEAYSRADLSLPDGQPLVWCSRALGLPLPEKVSGSDLTLPLLQLAGRRKWRVHLFGGAADVTAQAAEKMQRELSVEVVGIDCPMVPTHPSPIDDESAARLQATRPDLVLVCLGAPKSELWIDRVRGRVPPAVYVSVGASLEFYVGRVKRAPAWMQRAGLEWTYRLYREPTRLARRYLIQDPKFLVLLLRTLRLPRAERIRLADRVEATTHPRAT